MRLEAISAASTKPRTRVLLPTVLSALVCTICFLSCSRVGLVRPAPCMDHRLLLLWSTLHRHGVRDLGGPSGPGRCRGDPVPQGERLAGLEGEGDQALAVGRYPLLAKEGLALVLTEGV